MKNKYDINDFVKSTTIQSVTTNLVERIKQRRKEIKLTQRELALRSGVTYASIRRFETTGEISLSSLLKIANVLGTLIEFDSLFCKEIVTNLKDY